MFTHNIIVNNIMVISGTQTLKTYPSNGVFAQDWRRCRISVKFGRGTPGQPGPPIDPSGP